MPFLVAGRGLEESGATWAATVSHAPVSEMSDRLGNAIKEIAVSNRQARSLLDNDCLCLRDASLRVLQFENICWK